MRRMIVLGVVLAAVAAVVVAGCGSDSGGGSSGTSASGGGATVNAADGLGAKLLVDADGRTLYLFESDTGDKSTCSGACADAWPPLIATGDPTAGSGAESSKLGTIARDDGSMQVTYGGHPLYRFSGDMKAGDTDGQGSSAFGAEWYAVAPSGSAIEESGEDVGNGSGGAYG